MSTTPNVKMYTNVWSVLDESKLSKSSICKKNESSNEKGEHLINAYEY